MGNSVRNLRRFCVAAFGLSALAVCLAPLSATDKVWFVLISAVMLSVTEYGFRNAAPNDLYATVYATLAAYLWFAYPGKLALMLYERDASWINTISFLAEPSPGDLMRAFMNVSPALIAMLIGLGGRRVPAYRRRRLTNLGINSIVGITSLILLKVVLQVTWSIGVPGVQPKTIGVPFAAGVLAFVVGFTLVAFVNIYLFHAVLEENRPKIKIALVLVVVLVLSDLWVGYKQALVIEAVVMCYYLASSKPITAPSTRRLLLAFLAANLAGVIVIYQYVNEYRFALLRGTDVRSAISAVGSLAAVHRPGSVLSVAGRINGIDNFYVATRMTSASSFGVHTLFDQSLGASFNAVLFSGDDVNTRFGLTQFGAFYVVGGVPLAIVCGLIYGWMMRVTSRVVLRYILGSTSWAVAFTPLLALWFLRLLFAGGELLLYGKEIVVTCALLYAALKLSAISARTTNPDFPALDRGYHAGNGPPLVAATHELTNFSGTVR